MADFSKVFPELMAHEGGYVDDKNDRGGETYRGISRKYWPGWPGWHVVDMVTRHFSDTPTINAALAECTSLRAMVRGFYEEHFWSRAIEGIESQEVANFFVLLAVNISKYRATKILQEITGVKVDGAFGPVTLISVNAMDPGYLLTELRAGAKAYYDSIVESWPDQGKFLAGWYNRIGIEPETPA